MSVPYRNLARQIINELNTQIDTLDDTRVKHVSKMLCAFYQYATYQGALSTPTDEDDNSMYVITMGVLMNHFLKHESPQAPSIELPSSLPEISPPLPEN
jgi:hypothetical protein